MTVTYCCAMHLVNGVGLSTNMVEAFVWDQEKTFNELLKAAQGDVGGNQRRPLSTVIITH